MTSRISNQYGVKISFRVILLYIFLQEYIIQSKQINTQLLIVRPTYDKHANNNVVNTEMEIINNCV